MFRSPSVFLLLLVGVVLGAAAARADTLILAPDQDNTLYERPAGDVSNGAGTSLFFGRTGVNAGNVLRRALLRFDLSAIPPGSTINSVELRVEVDLVPPGATGFDAALHRVQASWGEGASAALGAGGSGAPAVAPDATWLHREFDTVFWGSPGGDFDVLASGSAPVGAGTGPVVFAGSAGLVADVSDWVNDPSANHGWILLGEESNPQNARRIGSRENAFLAPQLVIDFDPLLLPEARPVPVLGAKGLVLMGLLVLVVAIVTLRFRRG